MTCRGQHSIELKKYGEGFVYSREICLLSGSIKSPCSIEFIKIRRTNDGSYWVVGVFSRFFKQLISLLPDCDNHLELQYCDSVVDVTFRHESSVDKVFMVQPLYIINENSDGEFQSSNCNENKAEHALIKIDLAMKLAQCVFSAKLNESMQLELSFVLQPCKIFRSRLSIDDARAMNQWSLYDAVASEIVDKNGLETCNRTKFVGFLSCTKYDGLGSDEEYSYTNIKAKTHANPALGGGFLCLMGSGCFYSWPNCIEDVAATFSSKERIDLSKLLDDSNYRNTFGGCFATTLGALVHELGHCFNLAHTETGLMGNDVDFINRFYLSENLTEILPKRLVRSCQLTEKPNTKVTGVQRFTKIKQPGTFLKKYHEQKDNDMTFFEPNCILTLRYNSWFTQNVATDKVVFLETERLLKSQKSLLKLVEVRELESKNSMLVTFWPLDASEFAIPPSVDLANKTLFAVTSCGYVFKKDFPS